MLLKRWLKPKFSPHALERLSEYGLDKEEVLDVVNKEPPQVTCYRTERNGEKRWRIDDESSEIVVVLSDDKELIVTNFRFESGRPKRDKQE